MHCKALGYHYLNVTMVIYNGKYYAVCKEA